MHFYKLDDNNKITCAFRVNDFESACDEVKEEFLFTEKEIVDTVYNGLMFADDVDQQAEEQAIAQKQAEEQAQAEAEELKPTVEDLAEALDILTNIVLGGE